MSFRGCNHLSITFQSIMSDSDIAKQWSLAHQKTPYVIEVEMGLLKKIFAAVYEKQKVCLL